MTLTVNISRIENYKREAMVRALDKLIAESQQRLDALENQRAEQYDNLIHHAVRAQLFGPPSETERTIAAQRLKQYRQLREEVREARGTRDKLWSTKSQWETVIPRDLAVALDEIDKP